MSQEKPAFHSDNTEISLGEFIQQRVLSTNNVDLPSRKEQLKLARLIEEEVLGPTREGLGNIQESIKETPSFPILKTFLQRLKRERPGVIGKLEHIARSAQENGLAREVLEGVAEGKYHPDLPAIIAIESVFDLEAKNRFGAKGIAQLMSPPKNSPLSGNKAVIRRIFEAGYPVFPEDIPDKRYQHALATKNPALLQMVVTDWIRGNRRKGIRPKPRYVKKLEKAFEKYLSNPLNYKEHLDIASTYLRDLNARVKKEIASLQKKYPNMQFVGPTNYYAVMAYNSGFGSVRRRLRRLARRRYKAWKKGKIPSPTISAFDIAESRTTSKENADYLARFKIAQESWDHFLPSLPKRIAEKEKASASL